LPRSFTASRLESAGLTGHGGRHAHFEALLSSRVRSRDDRVPGQVTVVRSVLSWAFSPLELAPRNRGHGARANERRRDEPDSVRPRARATWPRVFARFSRRPRGLEPADRRLERSIEPLTPPSGSDPARARIRDALARRSPAPSGTAWEAAASSAHPDDETCCPRPLSAALHASRSFNRSPPRGGARLDLGDARSRSLGGPTSREVSHLLWGFAPRRACS
jgi:hypothetical protein